MTDKVDGNVNKAEAAEKANDKLCLDTVAVAWGKDEHDSAAKLKLQMAIKLNMQGAGDRELNAAWETAIKQDYAQKLADQAGRTKDEKTGKTAVGPEDVAQAEKWFRDFQIVTDCT